MAVRSAAFVGICRKAPQRHMTAALSRADRGEDRPGITGVSLRFKLPQANT